MDATASSRQRRAIVRRGGIRSFLYCFAKSAILCFCSESEKTNKLVISDGFLISSQETVCPLNLLFPAASHLHARSLIHEHPRRFFHLYSFLCPCEGDLCLLNFRFIHSYLHVYPRAIVFYSTFVQSFWSVPTELAISNTIASNLVLLNSVIVEYFSSFHINLF